MSACAARCLLLRAGEHRSTLGSGSAPVRNSVYTETRHAFYLAIFFHFYLVEIFLNERITSADDSTFSLPTARW